MATVTGLTADRMLAIEGQSVISGRVAGDNLMLTKHDGSEMNAGNVRGPKGDKGDPGTPGAPGAPGTSVGGAIPGEIRMWPGSALPAAGYGKWVWADGAVYAVATYPIAAGSIAAVWRTFAGASDPGGANFRVPDMRGMTPVGMDAMPGGVRANRMTRAVAITLAGRSGEETHTVSIAEMPTHFHGGGFHNHDVTITQHEAYSEPNRALLLGSSPNAFNGNGNDLMAIGNSPAQIIQHEGGGTAHENVQPSVFMPYIICLNG